MTLPFRDIVFKKCNDVVVVALPVSEIDIYLSNVPIPEDLISATAARQREYVAGRLCARAAILRRTGVSYDIGRNVRGLPDWPSGVYGSISHSTEVACAAIADRSSCTRIGVDVESVVSDHLVDAVLDVCARHEERTWFSSAVGATILFSAKEAFYKAFSDDLGSVIDFTDVCASPLQSDNTVRLTLQRPIGRLLDSHHADVHVALTGTHVTTLLRY